MTPNQIKLFKKDILIGRLESTLQAVETMVRQMQMSCIDVRNNKSLDEGARDTATLVLQDCAYIQEIIQVGLDYEKDTL